MTRRALIVGVSGQDGAYLARLLVDKGYEVHGATRRTSGSPEARLEALGIVDAVRLHYLDLLEITNIRRVLERVAPDEVYNLAAQSFVSASFEQPLVTSDVNAMGALRLLESLREAGARARFYQASTSEMFGNIPIRPQTEETPFHPRSPYGFAKVFAHSATVNYREAYGMHASSGILFNHESPLRGAEFVTRKITTGLARLARGSEEPVALGNLDARRDWGFAGDYVEGMWRMLQQDAPGDYVLATGISTSVRSFVEHAARSFGWSVEWRGSGRDEQGVDARTGRRLVTIDPTFWRPAEVDHLLGNPAKAKAVLGWTPLVDVRGLAEMMAEADLRRLANAAVAA
ncbi:MAG: GDP-mannose 4,6-dehydratase [Bauldia sp.]|nr:GDP-mannose 4,6-dehydratase [Bauldia sp.]